nr:MAG TPA: hypothetical protein [Caudoviricetes sp.]
MIVTLTPYHLLLIMMLLERILRMNVITRRYVHLEFL